MLSETDLTRAAQYAKELYGVGESHRDVATTSYLAGLRAGREQAAKEIQSLSMVAAEARELIAEADHEGVIPQANIDALRALLWRADIRSSRGR